MPTDLVAVVTGAGSGIGRIVATALLGDGYRVALAGRTKAALQNTAAGHPGALVVPTDIAEPDSVAALFAAVRSAFGRLDLLFNNAGVVGPRGDVDQISPAEWSRVVDTNLTGAFLCAHYAVALMKRQDPQGGRIINNGSVSAHSPRPGSAAYTATKHALTGLTKSIALDGRPYRIACGQIDIGNAATDITAGIFSGTAQADGATRSEATFDAQHVADAVLLMARLPLDANVLSMTLTATAMPLVGRG